MNEYAYTLLDSFYPIDALFELFQDEKNIFFLNSSQYVEHRGRYSFLGFDPFETFTGQDRDILKQLKEKHAFYKSFLMPSGKEDFQAREDSVPFISGLVGYLGYDHGLQLETMARKEKEDFSLGNYFFGFYDCVIAADHKLKKLFVFSCGLPEASRVSRKKRALSRKQYILTRIREAEESGFFIKNAEKQKFFKGLPSLETEPFFDGIGAELIANFTKEGYLSAVNQALEYIAKGDIYQVNLSQRFHLDLSQKYFNPVDAYSLLASLSPSSFSGYLDCGAYQIISSSPERFLVLRGKTVETRPMKGTKPRGIDGYADKKMLGELIGSPKEKAELLMITDLLRNDLGRACEYGSVYVKELRHIEQYQTVFQATSTVAGRLKSGHDAFDLLQACFPGGSITGCPKIRAMQIIDELEPTYRSVYTGSLGYIDWNGDMDFNILIRTFLHYRNHLYFQVGGGIVYDSIPEREYQETLVKARALKKCIEYLFQSALKNFD